MSVSPKTCALFLLLLWVGGAWLCPSASAQGTLPSAQETTLAALETNAAHYPPGLLVAVVTKGSVAEQAGVEVGDLLLTFDGMEMRFSLQLILVRDKARWDNKKTILLKVKRGMQELEISLNVAPLLGLVTQPPLSGAVIKLYSEANVVPKDKLAEKILKLKSAADVAENAGDLRAAAWLWNETYQSAPNGSHEEVEALYGTLSCATKAGDALLIASSLNNLGVTSYNRNQLAEAESFYQRALAIEEKLAPHSLDVASSLYDLGLVAYNRNKLEEAENYYQRALPIQEKLAPNSPELANSLNDLGVVAHDRRKLEEAEHFYQNALAIRAKLDPNSVDVANSLNNLGVVAYSRHQLDEAERFYQRALAIEEKLAPNSLAVANCVNELGSVAFSRGKLEEAENLYQHALALREKLAPDSLDVAISLNNLGYVVDDRGQLEMAEKSARRALAIEEKRAPNSLEVARSLDILGTVARNRGQLDDAKDHYQSALAIREKLAPNSVETAIFLNNLGTVAGDRGQLAEAENLFQRALAIEEKLAPNSLYVARSLATLGMTAEHRGQLDEAENFYQRALTIEEKLVPDSVDVADSFGSLGNIADDHGHLEEAESFYQRALAIEEKLAPNSLSVASSLNDLGIIAYGRNKLEEAESFHQRALAIEEKLAPNSLGMASSLNDLGNIAYHRDKLDEAENYFQRALAIREKLAPNSLNLANNLNSLGIIAYNRDRTEEAETLLSKAWRIVRTQGRQVAGDKGRQGFGERFSFIAANLLTFQLQGDHPKAAFATLEEGRSQALVQLLCERGLTEKVTPPTVWQGYQQALNAYNVAFKTAEQSAAPMEKARVLLAALKEQKADATTLQEKEHVLTEAEQAFSAAHSAEVGARAAMESRWAEVRRSTKAAIPEPIDANTAHTSLSSGTLVLEFSVSEKKVVLFAATAVGVQAYPLAATREELEAKVKFVRRLVAQDTEERAALANDNDVRDDALRTLYGKLFPPEVQAAIQQAKRVVVSPDDFLWDLPFGALITNVSGTPAYLAQQKPLSFTQSLTLYLQPSRTNETSGVKSLTASEVLIIGNPLYDNSRRAEMIAAAQKKAPPTGSAGAKPPVKKPPVQVASARRDGELGLVTVDGKAPPQLEFAQKEAEQISALYHTSAHIGVEPTEAWFRQRVSQARIIHLATHGFLNPFAAQSSGVLLAVPNVKPPMGQYDNDGTLQAWEVWSLKLKADLVVLSACETGRGAKVTGEGLIGLTRAWQYAGAKTVVSSLWKVSDASTAALMTSFHKHLLAGVEKDEALRLAMTETAASKQGAWSQPHYWAAFVLVGDTGRLQ